MTIDPLSLLKNAQNLKQQFSSRMLPPMPESVQAEKVIQPLQLQVPPVKA